MPVKIKSICLGFTCLLIMAVAGCITTTKMFQDRVVSPEQVLSIRDPDPIQGTMENFDIIISYQFTRVGDVLEISGEAALTPRYPVLYDRLKHLYVYLFFLDDASRVLATVSLATAIYSRPDERLEFTRSLNVPSGAAGISFGYDGEVMEGGDRFSSSYTFYRLPLNKGQ